MTTTIYKYYDVDNSRVFFDWTPNRPQDEYHGAYTMTLPDECKVVCKHGCFMYIEHGGELYDLLTDNKQRPYIQVGAYRKIYFDVVED